MARLLRQSTAFVFRIGPFLDSTDFVTAESALTIAQADIQISKNGGAFAQTSDASPTTTHDTDGWYQCPLTATDTGTLGPLTVQIVVSGALPVWEHFMVVPANVYDSLVAGSDTLQADLTQIGGVAQSATDLKDLADTGYDPTTHKVQGVVLVDTTTTNTDMRGTDSAALASVCTEARLAELDAANLPAEIDGLQGADGKCAISTDAQDLSATLDVNAKALGGTVQSATDLKDFADTGYDPATHKVQGVVLADTTTTNTDMRGTDNAALAATALSNATWTDAKAAYLDAAISSVSGTAGSGADNVTIRTTTTGGIAVEGVGVWITSDEAGTNVVAGTLYTDSAGDVTFHLDAGVTYWLWRQKDGYEFDTVPESFVAVAD